MEAAARAKRLKESTEADVDAAAQTTNRLETDDDGGCQPLPEEIVEDILSRLPVKSLQRFRCVSREWDAVITSAAFKDLHFERFSGGGGGNRAVFLNPQGPFYPFYSWKLGGPVETILSTGLPPGNVYPITKSYHGLILLRCTDNNTHYVWNPSAGKILALPDRTPSRMAGRTRIIFYVSYGMGYCSTSNRYKVVRMYNLGVGNGLPEDTACEVFVLGESTHWRPAATQPPACQIRVRGSQGAVLCNGNLHFTQKRQNGGLDITTFNVARETFSTMELPAELNTFSCGFMLTELDGCLCVYHVEHQPKFEDPYYIWLLRDYEAGQWEGLRCIDWGSVAKTESAPLKSSWIAPLDLYNDDQKKKIMFGTGTCKVFVVDPDIGIPETLFSPDGTPIGECGDSQFPTMGLFEESLVPVGPTSEDIIFSSPSALFWSEVLTYLPARTVGRLNQVCKGWRAMIKAKCFVHAHLYRANLNKSPRIMFADGKPWRFRGLEDLIDTSNTPPLVDNDDGSRVTCSKPCHGLNAGSFGKYDFVCNPLTKYYKATDDKGREWSSAPHDTLSSLYYHIQKTPPSSSAKDGVLAGRLGLGFDHDIGMHVLVRLAYKKKDLVTRDYELECWIRLIDQRGWYRLEPHPPRPVADVPPVYADGKLYWMADPELGPRPPVHGSCEIVLLDLSTREFQVLEGPPIGDGSGRRTVVELGGEVCVVRSRRNTNTIEIWAADGTAGAWSVRHRVELARFSLDYSSEEASPLTIDPSDGRILLSTGRALGYYDPKTVELETIYRLGPHIEAGKKFVPILYMDSLVEP